ncbi:MAG: nitronate monooxygenase [Cytophagales bacterium]|nr:nitronate monooxygenase [Cytophagales bacterium]MDW8384522.1 nitronate monooxygenase [Flammeovirgaceae bacterium]
MSNRIQRLLGIRYPIIQAGMVWCSGWKLASAVSNAGGLGLIGAGSMTPDVLQEHIQKCKKATQKPFGVNLPLIYSGIEQQIEIIEKENVKIVFTSAGNPKLYTSRLKSLGITVVHVVSSVKFALKAQEAGVDAVVAEGFEAGGHNGREETTTLCLIPAVRQAIELPLIAAGGIASGRAMLAAFALGAEGVQVGSRFAISHESSAHQSYKEAVLRAQEGDTVLTLKALTPVRMIRNAFYEQVRQAEERGASVEELRNLLGKGRARRGIFEGDLQEGELEIGQVSMMLNRSESAAEIVADIWQEFCQVKQHIALQSFEC